MLQQPFLGQRVYTRQGRQSPIKAQACPETAAGLRQNAGLAAANREARQKGAKAHRVLEVSSNADATQEVPEGDRCTMLHAPSGPEHRQRLPLQLVQRLGRFPV